MCDLDLSAVRPHLYKAELDLIPSGETTVIRSVAQCQGPSDPILGPSPEASLFGIIQ